MGASFDIKAIGTIGTIIYKSTAELPTESFSLVGLLSVVDKGKPVERRGHKATDPKPLAGWLRYRNMEGNRVEKSVL